MESLGTHAKKLPLEDPDDPTAFAAALIDRVIAIQGEVAAKSKEAFKRSRSRILKQGGDGGKGFKIGDLVLLHRKRPSKLLFLSGKVHLK